MTPDELRKLAGAPATEIWIGTVRAALRHAADLADAAHDVRDENERLRADLASVHQAITDSENQPSQYGTVTLAMYEKAEAERDALAKDTWRLDWLDAQWRDPIHLEVSARSVKGDCYVRECVLFMPKGEVRAADVRSTIDAALAQIEQENNDAARG